MNKSIFAFAFLTIGWSYGYPPGSPMSEFGPSQVSVAAFFDHSGQDLFVEGYPSLLNTTGLSLDYAPWPYIQMGIFGGGGELDAVVPVNLLSDTTKHDYLTDYGLYGGASVKLATPRFLSNTTRLVSYGSAGYLKSSDALGNSKTPIIYNGGVSIQFMVMEKLNFVVGGEYYAWDGEQKSATGQVSKNLGISKPGGDTDYLRGLVGVEYFFKGKSRPFISVAFRPNAKIGWRNNMGLQNGSISISLGAMTNLGKTKNQTGDDEPSLIDQ